MAKISEFNKLGQSIWSDYLRRSFIDSGELEDLIKQGLSGVTSNPTIFEKAISGSTDYDQDLRRFIEERKSIREIYESLVVEDISRTADLLRPIYDTTKGADGFVSVEVDPKLANDADGMIDEAHDFFNIINRPNVMIKIPATEEGFSAIRSLIGEGINVNVTLIFSQRQYERSAEAYLSGLERLVESGKDPSCVSSVASFFVSRVDSAVDNELEKIGADGEDLKGKIGIANAKIAYAKFHDIFSGPRWEKLRSKGARVQRVLWGSTSTKNPAYPDTLYVDNLVGKDTVNTLPLQTIKALLDHGVAQNSIETGVDQARKDLKRLGELGIDLDKITDKLEEEGIEKFSESIDSLFDTIAQKKERMISEPYLEPAIKPPKYQGIIDSALNRLSSDLIVRRIWNHDHSVWKPEPTEISNRLGWLESPTLMEENVRRIEELVDGVIGSGYTQVLLLGMGGSSLAPETFARTFGTVDGFLELSILDSAKPEEIESKLKGLDLGKTLFIVSTKSGNTVETLSFFKFFYNKMLEFVRSQREEKKRGQELQKVEDGEKIEVGQHFIAITDPGSPLVSIADKYSFRAKFLNDPNVGGRYSALSYFGLVPAGLIGVDLRKLLDNALTMAASCESSVDIKDNPGAWLGATIGEFAIHGRNKLTLVATEKIESLCDWIEQLIAESTGKEGKGILPVVGEKLGAPSNYGDDRLFVYIRLGNDTAYEDKLSQLESAGFPIIRLRIRDPYEIAKQFFQWEFATAVAGHILGINPFDQPNVESSKENARKMVSTYLEKGTFPPEAPVFTTPQGVRIYGRDIKKLTTTNKELSKLLLEFIETNRKNGSYIALQAYLQYNQDIDNHLQEIRTYLRDHFKLATTMGYGPRFLHSTGQLHKGDSGAGLFVQFTSDTEAQHELPIPDEAGDSKSSISFGVLEMAEALGDRKTLEERGRSVISIDLGNNSNVESALEYLRNSISSEAIQATHSS
jgi:transaldolase/glucose-6-phosphate isomerase